jgi:hypothetical protein
MPLIDRIGIDIGSKKSVEDGLLWAAAHGLHYVDFRLDTGLEAFDTVTAARCWTTRAGIPHDTSPEPPPREAARAATARPGKRALAMETSDRRDGAPVDDILAAGDRCGAIRGEEGHQLGDLCRPRRTAQRDATE